MELSAKTILESCKANGGYSTPSLNDQIYLQCKGIGKIRNLEPYVGLKALWLDSNAIREVEGLEQNIKLCALYLNNNSITRISGLDTLRNLHTLNVSHNVISRLSGLRELRSLETLHATHNRLEFIEDLEELLHCPSLTCVDLAHNPLTRAEGEADDAIVTFFSQMPNLSVLYLTGTEIAKTMRFYRRTMISRMPKLQYLDERPVFDEERRTVMAWVERGDEGEREERAKISEEKRDKLTRDVFNLQKLAEEKRHIKEKRTAEWAKIQEEEEQFWRSKTEKRRDMAVDEAGGRSALENDEDVLWTSMSEVFESGANSILAEEARVREEKEKRRKELEALRTPLEDSRRELLRQVKMWGEEGAEHKQQQDEEDLDGDAADDHEALLRKFDEEVRAELFAASTHPDAAAAPPQRATVTRYHDPNSGGKRCKQTTRSTPSLREAVLGGGAGGELWTPSVKTQDIWRCYAARRK